MSFTDPDTVLSIAMTQYAETTTGLSLQIVRNMGRVGREPTTPEGGGFQAVFQLVDRKG